MCKLPSMDHVMRLENGAEFRVQEHCRESGGQRGWLGQTSRGLRCHLEGQGPCPRLLGTTGGAGAALGAGRP